MSAKNCDDINPLASASKPDGDTSGAHNLDAHAMPVVADIAHDLHNLASNFKTRLYLTEKSPQRLAEHLAVLEQDANRLDALVQRLAAISQPQLDSLTAALHPLNLNDVAAPIFKAYEPVAYAKRLTLTFETAPDLSPILADALDIERVVINLLCNALNYTPAEGTITLTTARDNNSVLLTVRDTGIGISSQALPHIFERFYRSEEAQNTTLGTGLGLGIVKGIVEKYGGQVEVESTFGKGSVFKVVLPAYIDKPVALYMR